MKIYHSFSEYSTDGSFTIVPDNDRHKYLDNVDDYILIGHCDIEPLSQEMLRKLGAKELDKKIAEKYFEIKNLEDKKQQLLCLEVLK